MKKIFILIIALIYTISFAGQKKDAKDLLNKIENVKKSIKEGPNFFDIKEEIKWRYYRSALIVNENSENDHFVYEMYRFRINGVPVKHLDTIDTKRGTNSFWIYNVIRMVKSNFIGKGFWDELRFYQTIKEKLDLKRGSNKIYMDIILKVKKAAEKEFLYLDQLLDNIPYEKGINQKQMNNIIRLIPHIPNQIRNINGEDTNIIFSLIETLTKEKALNDVWIDYIILLGNNGIWIPPMIKFLDIKHGTKKSYIQYLINLKKESVDVATIASQSKTYKQFDENIKLFQKLVKNGINFTSEQVFYLFISKLVNKNVIHNMILLKNNKIDNELIFSIRHSLKSDLYSKNIIELNKAMTLTEKIVSADDFENKLSDIQYLQNLIRLSKSFKINIEIINKLSLKNGRSDKYIEKLLQENK